MTSTATRSPADTTSATRATDSATPVHRLSGSVDKFGRDVALSTETAVVVAEEHGAYVFEAGGGGWTNTTVLTPDDGRDFGGHNVSAALVGDAVVVGGPEAEGESVYHFERATDGWTQRGRISPEGSPDVTEFGRSVDADGDRVVVGNAHEPETMVSWVGSAYVFASDGAEWTQEASLETGAQDLFGTSVAIDGETVLVGAPFAELDGDETGAVYAYERGDGAWQRRTVLSPSASAETADGRFGQAVALDGDTAVVGAPETRGGTGSAFVFERAGDGWGRVAHLTPPDTADEVEFGRSVALVDGTALVGAPHARGTGRAYVYGAADGWTGPLGLAGADPPVDAEFGTAVALADGTALVGSPVFDAATDAYLFDL